MFARIPELSSSLASSVSFISKKDVKDVKSPPPSKRLDCAEGTPKEITGLQPEPTKSCVHSKTSVSHRRPSSVTEELCTNSSCRGGAGLDVVKLVSRRLSSGNAIQTRSLNQQQLHRSSATSNSPPRMAESGVAPPRPPSLESTNKVTSIMLCGEPVRRLSGGSFSCSKVSPDTVLEEGGRRNSESYQYRRRSSRDSSSRRRSSLVLTGSNYRVGRKIGSGNFGEIHLGDV